MDRNTKAPSVEQVAQVARLAARLMLESGGETYRAEDIANHIAADTADTLCVVQETDRLCRSLGLVRRHGMKRTGIRSGNRHTEDIKQDTQADKYRQHQQCHDQSRIAQNRFRQKAQQRRKSDRNEKNPQNP